MNGCPDPGLIFQVVGALQDVDHRLEHALEPIGLSMAKFGVLARLATAGEPLPLSTLAERCACVRSNITQLVDRLEAEQLVARTPDPRDRRSTRAELTAAGRNRYEDGLKVLESVERQVFAGLPEAERGELLRLLQVLCTNP